VVGERAVDIVHVAAVAMAADMRVDALARVPISYPTYAAILALGRAATQAAHDLGLGERPRVA
jgi:dihydrolipoamide dehydrogenase